MRDFIIQNIAWLSSLDMGTVLSINNILIVKSSFGWLDINGLVDQFKFLNDTINDIDRELRGQGTGEAIRSLRSHLWVINEDWSDISPTQRLLRYRAKVMFERNRLSSAVVPLVRVALGEDYAFNRPSD